MLLDSNIVIGAIDHREPALLSWLQTRAETFCVASVTRIEVLGYHRLTVASAADLSGFFSVVANLPLSDAIVAEAIHLRQSRRLSLGDAIIAATASVHRLPLVTRNTADFVGLTGVILIDPLAPTP